GGKWGKKDSLLWDRKPIDNIQNILTFGKKAIIWQYKFLNNFDSLYVLRSGDTTLFYYDKRFLAPKLVLIFPLEINNKWQLSTCVEYEVFGREIINLPLGAISNAFNIRESHSCEGEAGLVNNYYIEPYVGIVKYNSDYLNIHYSIKRKIEWNLKSYSISQ
ncbi:MAG: hypothetical protein ABIG69_08885, partial [Bacteroidota bacterium]